MDIRSTAVVTKTFVFTKEDAHVLRRIILDKVDWQEYNGGVHADFLEAFYDGLDSIAYPE